MILLLEELRCGFFVFIPIIPIGMMDWIALRENLQETIDFPIKYGAFL